MYRYITYSKEEEAILCIQSVHGFVCDGRPLRLVRRLVHVCNQLSSDFALTVLISLFVELALEPQNTVMLG